MFRSRTGLLRTRDGVGRSVAGRPMYDWWFSREKSILIVSSWMCQNSPRRKAIGEDPMFVGCGVGDGERWRIDGGEAYRAVPQAVMLIDKICFPDSHSGVNASIILQQQVRVCI